MGNYWSSVSASTITLYMAVTGGSDWEPLAKPIQEAGDLYYYLFLFYIAFMAVAVLNVLTGMFVDTAMKVADADDGNVMEEILEHDAQDIDNFREFLLTLNENGRNSILWEDVSEKGHLLQNNQKPVVSNFLKALEIEVTDMRRVFKLLEAKNGHDDRSVDVEEFIMGCSKVKGDQKGIDMLSLMSDTKKYMVQLGLLMEYSEERFDELHGLFEKFGVDKSSTRSLEERLKTHGCLPAHWHSAVERPRAYSRTSRVHPRHQSGTESVSTSS